MHKIARPHLLPCLNTRTSPCRAPGLLVQPQTPLVTSNPSFSFLSHLGLVLPSLDASPILPSLWSNVAALPCNGGRGDSPLLCRAPSIGSWVAGALSVSGRWSGGHYGLSPPLSLTGDGPASSGHLPAFTRLQSNTLPCTHRQPPEMGHYVLRCPDH